MKTMFKASVIFEAIICVNGYRFLTIYGHHVNGYFCCIPNWKLCCEMAEAEDVYYNTMKLKGCGIDEETAVRLADEIRRAVWKVEGRG